jgi:hypothetical protein
MDHPARCQVSSNLFAVCRDLDGLHVGPVAPDNGPLPLVPGVAGAKSGSSFSPRGNYYVYLSEDDSLHVMDVRAPGPTAAVATGIRPELDSYDAGGPFSAFAVSGDEKQIFFMNDALRVADFPDGANPRTIADGGEGFFLVKRSDGTPRALLTTRERKLTEYELVPGAIPAARTVSTSADLTALVDGDSGVFLYRKTDGDLPWTLAELGKGDRCSFDIERGLLSPWGPTFMRHFPLTVVDDGDGSGGTLSFLSPTCAKTWFGAAIRRWVEVAGVGILMQGSLTYPSLENGLRVDRGLYRVPLAADGAWNSTIHYMVNGATDFVFDEPSGVLLVSFVANGNGTALQLFRRLPF